VREPKQEIPVHDPGHCATWRIHRFASFLSRERCDFSAHPWLSFVCASQGTVGICIGVFLSMRTYDIIMNIKKHSYMYTYIVSVEAYTPVNF
jgi:hypothetical protein